MLKYLIFFLNETFRIKKAKLINEEIASLLKDKRKLNFFNKRLNERFYFQNFSDTIDKPIVKRSHHVKGF